MKAGPNANNPVFSPIYREQADGNEDWDFESAEYDLIVLSQSCDLVAGKVDNVVLCPRADRSFVKDDEGHPLKSAKMFQRAIENREPAFFVLAGFDDDELGREPSVVAFRQVYTLPLAFVARLGEQRSPRLRLRSPYREALSQRFGAFFQRVRLPYEIEV